jgi:glyoxylase-like metal-dependent hydrolase (beta-lactamase superfamily II)
MHDYMKALDFYSIHLGHTNCFLLRLDTGYLLIDTSFPQYYGKFKKFIDKNGIKLSDIKYLLLTHHHDDHAGFAQALRKDSNCRLIIHKEGIAALQKGKMVSTNKPLNLSIKLIMGLFNLLKRRDFSIEPVSVTSNDIIIEDEIDNKTLALIGSNGKILHTIGHTNDSLSVILDNGNTFPGDICMNWFNFCGTHYRPIFISDIKDVENSWDIIISNGSKMLFPSHGKSFSADKLEKSKMKYMSKQ